MQNKTLYPLGRHKFLIFDVCDFNLQIQPFLPPTGLGFYFKWIGYSREESLDDTLYKDSDWKIPKKNCLSANWTLSSRKGFFLVGIDFWGCWLLLNFAGTRNQAPGTTQILPPCSRTVFFCFCFF